MTAYRIFALTALAGFFLGVDLSQAQSPALAQPGFIAHDRAIGEVVFEFSSTVDRFEPGAWGALLITEEQGKQLSEVFLASMKEEEELTADTPSAERQQIGQRLREQINGIVEAHQVNTIKTINSAAQEILDKDPEGIPVTDASALLMAALKSSLSEEQYKNLELTANSYPNGKIRPL